MTRDAAAAGDSDRKPPADTGEAPRRRASGRARLVPPAVTPIRAGDLAAAGMAHARGRGRGAFRRAVADRLSATGVATYTSFRRALGACLQALAAEASDKSTVLVPAFCSSDYPDAVEGVGLELVRYGIDRETLSLDREAVEHRLAEVGDDALALVVVNVLGYGSPMRAIADRCADRDVRLVEALGYAFGSTYRDQPVGTFGDCAVLNFQEGKPIPVGGGMVVSQDPELDVADAGRPAVRPNVGAMAGYAACARPRLYYAYDGLTDWLAGTDLLADRVTTHPGSKRAVDYEQPLGTMSNFQGALGRRLLDRLPAHRRQRAATAQYYADALASCEGLGLFRPIAGLEDHQYVRYPLLADTAALRDALVSALARQGIQASALYGWPAIDGEVYPDARTLQQRLLALPTHPYVTATDRAVAVETIRRVLARR